MNACVHVSSEMYILIVVREYIVKAQRHETKYTAKCVNSSH